MPPSWQLPLLDSVFNLAVERGMTQYDRLKLNALMEELAVAETSEAKAGPFLHLLSRPKLCSHFLNRLKPRFEKLTQLHERATLDPNRDLTDHADHGLVTVYVEHLTDEKSVENHLQVHLDQRLGQYTVKITETRQVDAHWFDLRVVCLRRYLPKVRDTLAGVPWIVAAKTKPLASYGKRIATMAL